MVIFENLSKRLKKPLLKLTILNKHTPLKMQKRLRRKILAYRYRHAGFLRNASLSLQRGGVVLTTMRKLAMHSPVVCSRLLRLRALPRTQCRQLRKRQDRCGSQMSAAGANTLDHALLSLAQSQIAPTSTSSSPDKMAR